MINQIKHNSPSSVLSAFNPIAPLKPNVRKAVNERFILPILEAFFSHAERGGIDNFSALDPDKLITEIEFVKTENFVQTYIYKEIINEISKEDKKVKFKPKYVITFDEDLTKNKDLSDYDIDTTKYPYRQIFGSEWNRQKSPITNIKYGVIRLGEAPILYYILIDLQQLIKFIKTLPKEEEEYLEVNKFSETEEDRRNKLFDSVIFEKQRQLRNVSQTQKVEIEQEINRLEQVRQTALEGQSGKLRINLAWNTTDDLDLYVQTPNGTIFYKNKIVENQGIIGELDVDKNAGGDLVSNPQENVNFNGMPSGDHKIYVNFFAKREQNKVPFTVTIIPEDGEGRIFNETVEGAGNNVDITSFCFDGTKISFLP